MEIVDGGSLIFQKLEAGKLIEEKSF